MVRGGGGRGEHPPLMRRKASSRHRARELEAEGPGGCPKDSSAGTLGVLLLNSDSIPFLQGTLYHPAMPATSYAGYPNVQQGAVSLHMIPLHRQAIDTSTCICCAGDKVRRVQPSSPVE